MEQKSINDQKLGKQKFLSNHPIGSPERKVKGLRDISDYSFNMEQREDRFDPRPKSKLSKKKSKIKSINNEFKDDMTEKSELDANKRSKIDSHIMKPNNSKVGDSGIQNDSEAESEEIKDDVAFLENDKFHPQIKKIMSDNFSNSGSEVNRLALPKTAMSRTKSLANITVHRPNSANVANNSEVLESHNSRSRMGDLRSHMGIK